MPFGEKIFPVSSPFGRTAGEVDGNGTSIGQVAAVSRTVHQGTTFVHFWKFFAQKRRGTVCKANDTAVAHTQGGCGGSK